MFYTVEVQHVVYFWRLCDDRTWRPLQQPEDWAIRDGDVRVEDPLELSEYEERDMPAVLSGEQVIVNPRELSIGSYITVQTLHRTARPPIPSKEQLIQAIRQGDDRHTNALVLTLDGQFRVLKWHTFEIDDPTIAVRMEALGSGNGYIGPKAAALQSYIDDTFKSYLRLWIRHLETGEVHIWDDLGAGADLEQTLMDELNAVMGKQGWG